MDQKQHRTSKLIAWLLMALALPLPGTCSAQNNFIAGADMSFLAYYESLGIAYKDHGLTEDALQILKNHGINCIRLRLFTSSALQAQANPYNYINNTSYTIPLAARVKKAGLQFCLDFHYSDTWADPNHQATPAAWANLNFTQMVQQMRSYNSNTIAAFAAARAMPDYVQVGNEITQGMLFTNRAGATIGKVTGSYNTSWNQLGQLMKAALAGIQDAANAAGVPMPKIIVHIDRGADWPTTEWFFDNLTYQGVPFDFIGESYYPFWHGPLTNVAQCLTNAAQRYGKPILIAETDFPWGNSSTNIYGIPASTNGQVQYVIALTRVVKNVPQGLGAGIFWWGTEYQVPNANTAGFGYRSFFGSNASVLPVTDALGQTAVPVRIGMDLEGPDLTLQWPLSGAGMTLMSATSPVPPVLWLPMTNPVQNIGTTFNVRVPWDATRSHFYRLKSNSF